MTYYENYLEKAKQRRLIIMAELNARRTEKGIVRKLAEANGMTTQAIYHMMKVTKNEAAADKPRKRRK